MTVREEVRERIERDALLAKLRKKIESGKGTYADTAAYSVRAGKLLGEIFSRRLPEIQLEEREPLCVDLLHDQYIDINVAVDTVQRFRDEAQGFHLAPQHAPFDSERGHQIGSSLRDLSKPVETLQRRAKAATETATKAIHDDRMESEAKFRHKAGLDCRITRVAVNGCCPWCSKVAGRYVYGEEPDDIYRRHDNCDCTVTFENGRKRQDVWSKREWEAPFEDAGAGEPVVLTEEQAEKIQAEHGLTIMPKDGKINSEEEFQFHGVWGKIKSFFSGIFTPADISDVEITEALTKLGFSRVDSSFLKNTDKELRLSMVDQLKTLDDKFHVIEKTTKITIDAARKGSAVASVSCQINTPGIQAFHLSSTKFRNKKSHIAARKKDVKDFYCMPCNLDDETLSRYVVTHEYGHMLENFLSQQDMTGTIYTHQQKCEHYRNEILNIAKNLDENFSIDNFLSEYGSTNDKEFFAECFANSQLGQPNVLGNAMLIWLERRGFNVY